MSAAAASGLNLVRIFSHSSSPGFPWQVGGGGGERGRGGVPRGGGARF